MSDEPSNEDISPEQDRENHAIITDWAMGSMGALMHTLALVEKVADRWALRRDVLTTEEAAHEVRVALYGAEKAENYMDNWE